MIIWIASYPRSGNTLFRIVLDSMGLGPTYSLYDDPALKKLNIANDVGHKDLPEEGVDYLAKDDQFHFVKTHGLPRNDEFPTIYIVRDGRNALVSYAHYLKEIDKRNMKIGRLIANLITGEIGGFGLWSDHVRKWRKKPGKMVTVRYEDLAVDPVGIVCEALRGLQFPESLINENVDIPSFSDLKNKSPEFFRAGAKASWASDMTESLERQFWKRHRMGMALSGYETPDQKLPYASKDLPEVSINSLVSEFKNYQPIADEICMPPYYGPKDNTDFDCLINLALEIDAKEIFEFGTASGNTVANLCKHTNANITTLNAVPGNTSGKYRTYDLPKDQIGSVYRKYGFQHRVTQVYSDSLDFVPETITDIGFDLVIIDACHDFEYVMSDFLAIYQLVNPGGYVLFHDCDASMKGHLEGAWRACTHLRRAGFDIKKIEGTWWGVWSPSSQENGIDTSYLGILEYMIEHQRQRNIETGTRDQRIDNLVSTLQETRSVPGVKHLVWLSSMAKRIFGRG